MVTRALTLQPLSRRPCSRDNRAGTA
jgi:hypothetical protein